MSPFKKILLLYPSPHNTHKCPLNGKDVDSIMAHDGEEGPAAFANDVAGA